jgi:phosphinothricin acetyltransferase
MIEITLARREHVAQLLEITNQEALRSLATASYSDEPLTRWLTQWDEEHERSPWLVALDPSLPLERQVVGYAKASPFNPRDGFAWTVSLSVYLRPTHRARGLSARLYERLFELLRTQNYRKVHARIALPNPASVALHERFGLTQVGLMPRFAWKFERWYDLAVLSADLCEGDEPPSPLLSVEEAWRLTHP